MDGLVYGGVVFNILEPGAAIVFITQNILTPAIRADVRYVTCFTYINSIAGRYAFFFPEK